MAGLTREEIARLIAPYSGQYGNRWGTSFIDDYRNTGAARNKLTDIYNTYADDGLSKRDYNMYSSMLRGDQLASLMGGVTAGISGVTNLASQFGQASHTADISSELGRIDDLSRMGNYNYNNYEQLSNDLAHATYTPQMSYDDIRGMSTGQQVGSVATSALSGASAGMQIGGPWGAAIGGLVGIGTGIAGVVTGNREAERKQQRIQAQATLATDSAMLNFGAAHERLNEQNHRDKLSNVAAYGGGLKMFVDKKLRKPAQKEHGSMSSISRSHVEGGTRIKIKR